MKVYELAIENFRGIGSLRLVQDGHVLLVSEPGAGKSDVLEALTLVHQADTGRRRAITELDFHKKNVSQPILIEATLGDLGVQLEQEFLDQLEVWDSTARVLVAEASDFSALPAGQGAVLRIAFRADWDPTTQTADEEVYYVKSSRPAERDFIRVRWSQARLLGYQSLLWSSARDVDLGERGAFRLAVERMPGDDFGQAVRTFLQEVTRASQSFAQSGQVKAALQEMLKSAAAYLEIDSGADPLPAFFSPVAASESTLLRSLGLTLERSGIQVPLWRNGTTVAVILRLASLIAASPPGRTVMAIDDFGDGMDMSSAGHMAVALKRSAEQVWIATRMPEVANHFESHEIVRLRRTEAGGVAAHRLEKPENPAEIKSQSRWHRWAVPAMSHRAVVVVEGKHDQLAIQAIGERLSGLGQAPLMATIRATVVTPDWSGGGGNAAVGPLCEYCMKLGLDAVAVVDGDVPARDAQELAKQVTAVIQLPTDVAIELAILNGLPDERIVETVNNLCALYGLKLPTPIKGLGGKALQDGVIAFLKSSGGLHRQFLEELPDAELPPLLIALYKEIVDAVRGKFKGLKVM